MRKKCKKKQPSGAEERGGTRSQPMAAEKKEKPGFNSGSAAETAPTMESVACESECEKGAFSDVANESISVSRSLDQHRRPVSVFIFF